MNDPVEAGRIYPGKRLPESRGLASAQLAGEDFWTGLDRQCADPAGQ